VPAVARAGDRWGTVCFYCAGRIVARWSAQSPRGPRNFDPTA